MYLETIGVVRTSQRRDINLREQTEPLTRDDLIEEIEMSLISFEVNSSVHELTKKGELVIPRFREVQEGSEIRKVSKVPLDIKRGQFIEVLLRYENYFPFTEQYIVTSTTINGDNLIVKFEDNMYLLKDPEHMINVDYLDEEFGGDTGGESDLLQFVKQEVKKLSDKKGYNLNVRIFPRTLTYEVNEYTFADMTIAQVLEVLSNHYFIKCFFVGQILYIGQIYQGSITNSILNAVNHELDFVYDDDTQLVIDHSLNYYDDRDVNIEIECKNYRKDNTIDKETIFTSSGEVQRKISQVFYNLSPKAFDDSVKETVNRTKSQGFRGDIITFGSIVQGNRYMSLGDTITFNNVLSSNRVDKLIEVEIEEDVYLIEEITISYDVNTGIRQTAELGKKIN